MTLEESVIIDIYWSPFNCMDITIVNINDRSLFQINTYFNSDSKLNLLFIDVTQETNPHPPPPLHPILSKLQERANTV